MCWTLKDFISEAMETGSGRGYVSDLKSSLMKLKFFDKNNDLYQFKQVIIIIIIIVVVVVVVDVDELFVVLYSHMILKMPSQSK